MLRDLGGAVVGYFVVFVLTLLAFAAAWALAGPEALLRGDRVQLSGAWLGLSLAAAFVAAYLGGWVAARIGRSGRAVRLLVVILLALGAAQAVWTLRQPRRPAPTREVVEELTAFEAAAVATGPIWHLVLEPLLAAAGAVVGGLGRR